ncbi:efflux transporter, RND family, MFP subunit [Parvibaculum lavamentivorans DS-1]|uniref:Efflux transporter, RND family, MFP subunit n=1 Tax=Parvibaculum lavamentivorans (strain DS-1 / DSM 13023 / NCIMB 13966) TaxID=402881 RepID=A7HTC2_PARL1|nr:efflux RND transporter periplasmic adaptor subunit [Parvibaculum lavamentivorans]ABS63155.1 efflux transporter, RND family, MFP subunit [Parvibaculum lavamentivorans DS-1]
MTGFPRFVLVAVLGAFALAGCGEEASQTAEAETAIPVLVAEVRTAPEAGFVTAYGLVRPDREAALSFKISGLVRTIAVDAGDIVRKGDTLAELDMREIDADARRANAAAIKAKRDVDRIAPLLENGFVSRQRMQDAQTAYDLALAERSRVDFNRSLSRIVAPADGVVLSRLSEPNEIVNPGQPILTVSQGGGGFILKAGLADRDMARIQLDARASVTLDAFPGEKLAGTVRRIGAASEARTGTFEIEIALDNAPPGTASGFIGVAQIEPADENAAALAVPATAILEGHGAVANVYLLDRPSMTVRQKRIGIGRISGDEVIVTDGLKAGDQVVSAGAPYLREGAKVRVVTDLKAARAETASEDEAARP